MFELLLAGSERLMAVDFEQALQAEKRLRSSLEIELESMKTEMKETRDEASLRSTDSTRQILALKSQIKRLSLRAAAPVAPAVEEDQDQDQDREIKEEVEARREQRERANAILSSGARQKSSRMKRPMWEKLATEEVLEASCPPESFPVPTRPRGLVTEVERLETRLKEAENKLKKANFESGELRREKLILEKEGTQSLMEARERLKQHEPQLMGAMRRINWLVGEKAKLEEKAEGAEEYSRRLEKKLIEKEGEVQRLKKASKAPVVKAVQGGFSYWGGMASPSEFKSEEDMVESGIERHHLVPAMLVNEGQEKASQKKQSILEMKRATKGKGLESSPARLERVQCSEVA